MDRRNYLEILSEQIRCKRALPLVTGELEVHIEEQKADFMTEGMTEREAEEAAVRCFCACLMWLLNRRICRFFIWRAICFIWSSGTGR